MYNTQLGLVLSSMCSEPIFEHGLQAYKDNQAQRRSEAFDLMVMTVIFTTGIVSGCMPVIIIASLLMLYAMVVLPMRKQKNITCMEKWWHMAY
ncbi:MAG: hypothetical protein ACLRZ2_09415 [Veillonella sp.]